MLSGQWKGKEEKEGRSLLLPQRRAVMKGMFKKTKSKLPKETKPTLIIKMVKEELETMRQAMEDVKVQMADLKKNKKPVHVTRTNVWCTRCKKEGHHPEECKADWRMIQEAKASTE